MPRVNRHDAWEWFHDLGCQIGKYDGHLFVIVPSWNVVGARGFRTKLWAMVDGGAGVNKYSLDDYWGFFDEYDICAECDTVIRTSPDSYRWLPKYWSTEDGDICVECVKRNFRDEYLEECISKSTSSTPSACTLIEDLGGYAGNGFSLLVEDCENGFHEGQNDNPGKLGRFLDRYGFETVFDVSAGQFDVSFDVWVRRKPDEDGNRQPMTEEDIAALADKVAHRDGYGGKQLNDSFKDFPSPADQAKEGLRRASEQGLNFVRITTGVDGVEVKDISGELREAGWNV